MMRADGWSTASATLLCRAVFDVIRVLPRQGLGQKVSRKSWQDNSYWTIERVKISLVGHKHHCYMHQASKLHPHAALQQCGATWLSVWRCLSGLLLLGCRGWGMLASTASMRLADHPLSGSQRTTKHAGSLLQDGRHGKAHGLLTWRGETLTGSELYCGLLPSPFHIPAVLYHLSLMQVVTCHPRHTLVSALQTWAYAANTSLGLRRYVKSCRRQCCSTLKAITIIQCTSSIQDVVLNSKFKF